MCSLCRENNLILIRNGNVKQNGLYIGCATYEVMAEMMDVSMVDVMEFRQMFTAMCS